MNPNITRFITLTTTQTPPLPLTDFCSLFVDVIERKASLKEINFFLRLWSKRRSKKENVDWVNTLDDEDVAEFIIHSTAEFYGSLEKTSQITFAEFRSCFVEIVGRKPSLAESNLFLWILNGCRNDDDSEANWVEPVETNVAKFLSYVVKGVAGIPLKLGLTDFRALFANVVDRKASLVEINTFMTLQQGTGPYNVPNGLCGMMRDIILRMCGLMWNAEEKIRAVLGMCAKNYCWKNHSYFIEGRVKFSHRFVITGTHGKNFRAYPPPEKLLKCDAPNRANWESFRIQPHGNKVAFKGAHGYYMQASPIGNVMCNAPHVGSWEAFHLVTKDGTVLTANRLRDWNWTDALMDVAILSTHGTFVTAHPDGKLTCTVKENKGWEKFRVEDNSSRVKK